MSDYAPILHTIDSFLSAIPAHRESPVIIAIDGMSCSGKTTLATYLTQHYDCHVFHMDDFFLRPEQRTAERLSETGGNVDYERFLSEVLTPLQTGNPFSYRKYSCKTQTLLEPIHILPKSLYFVEGAYSTHPYFQNPYDMMLFLETTEEIQKSRILSRNGEFLYQRFISEWIPMENAYFDAFHIREKCKCFSI